MRNCVIGLWLIACCYLTGCGLFASASGVTEYVDENGVKRVRVEEDSMADRAQSILLGLGPWGGAGSRLHHLLRGPLARVRDRPDPADGG